VLSLNDALLSGAKLKKVEPNANPPKSADVRSGLMDQLKGGIKLKAATAREVKPEVKKDSTPSSVAEILSRRIAIVGDSDDEEDDDDGGWDD
jgi:hypothetical protein